MLVKYTPSKGVLMLPIQQTSMYSNPVRQERTGWGHAHVGKLCIVKKIKEGVTVILRLFSDDCTASL
jgi:hypothetical protein